MDVLYFKFYPPLVLLDPVVDDFGNVFSTTNDFGAFETAWSFLESAGALTDSEGGIH